MSAVVRVKRRIDEEPLNAFVLNCKRRKVDDVKENLLATKDEVSTILKFAGTVASQDDNVATQITKLTKQDAKQLVQRNRKLNVKEKCRQEMRQSSHDSRFKIVNCYRTVNESEETLAAKEITVVDIEKQANTSYEESEQSNSYQEPPEEDVPNNFVYDLYIPESDGFNTIDDNLVTNLLSIRPFDDLVQDPQDSDIDDYDDDSEDSNNENYYKNEYPDTDEDKSINDDDIRFAVNDLDLDGDRGLSSDDEDSNRNGFVYSIDSEAIGFEDDVDYCDINRYGELYARFKGRTSRKIKDSDDHDCEDDNIDYDSD